MQLLIYKILSEESPHYWKQLNKEILPSVEPRIKKCLKSNHSKTRDDVFRLNFCLIFDYHGIVVSKWILFKRIFGDQKLLLSHITNINNFRSALMHSREIDVPTRKLAEASLVWFDTIFSNNLIAC